jgi:hypothetical protein
LNEIQWITLALKIVLISGFASLVTWVAVYTRLAAWWRNPIGRTLVAKTLLIAGMFVPSILSLFFRLNKQDSLIAGWVDVGLIGAVTPVMLWRTAVWLHLNRTDRLPRDERAVSKETAFEGDNGS